MLRIAINGFGRIGRRLTRLALESERIEVVAIGDMHPVETMCHLFKWDSIHGAWKGVAEVENGQLKLGGQNIRYSVQTNVQDLPWQDLDIDVVVDCTGHFKTKEALQPYFQFNPKQVILSVPSTDNSVPMVVLGVLEDAVAAPLISNASCTTNSAAPMVELLDEICGIESCYITTVHSYTLDQNLHDAPHRDLRRARGAAQSIVPTTTGAAKALTHIFPHLSVSIGGFGIRVPVPDGSLTDITCTVRTPRSTQEVNHAFEQAAKDRYRGIVEYTTEPLVSADIIGNRHSCIFDSGLTSVIGNMVKIIGWYDNETGYSARLLDLILRLDR